MVCFKGLTSPEIKVYNAMTISAIVLTVLVILAEEWRPPKQMERWVLKHRLRSENMVDWEEEVKKSKVSDLSARQNLLMFMLSSVPPPLPRLSFHGRRRWCMLSLRSAMGTTTAEAAKHAKSSALRSHYCRHRPRQHDHLHPLVLSTSLEGSQSALHLHAPQAFCFLDAGKCVQSQKSRPFTI